MAVTLLALFRRPEGGDDALQTFWRRYREEHMPLIEKAPGLQGTEVWKVAEHYAGEDVVLVTEMHFADQEEFAASMASDEMRAARRVLREIAPGLLTLLVLEPSET